MRRRLPFLLAAVAFASSLGAGTPLWADPLPGPEDTVETSEQVVSRFFDSLYAKRFSDALVASKALQPDESNVAGVAFVDAMRASALLGLKRNDEAQELITQIRHLASKDPSALSTLFAGGLLADRSDVAADAFDEMLIQFPNAARDESTELVSFLLRNEPKGQDKRNEDRRIALVRNGYASDKPQGDYLAASAIDILMKRGDTAGAAGLLGKVKEPQLIENMLIQKRFISLWPKVEQIAGPHLQAVRLASVANAEKAYLETPDNHQRLAFYINALRNAGRLEDAVALRSKLPATIEAMSAADEDMGWAVNNVALALHEAGRADEADQLFAMLNDAPMPQEYWRISMKINRLELLVGDGKYAKALPLVEPTAQTKGSPFADQLVRRIRYCALSGLGRKEEAAKYFKELLAHSDDAPGPTIDGLVCAGQLDQAEEIALKFLKSKKDTFPENFVRQLQSQLLTSEDPSVWRWEHLRSRPAIQAEFDRLGRDMPAEWLVEKSNAGPKQ